MKAIVFYHGDADGECSAVAYAKYNKVVTDVTFKSISYGYDSEMVRDAMKEYERVVFVDFTPTLEDIDYRFNSEDVTCEVSIYDHHWNASKKYAERYGFDTAFEADADWICWGKGGVCYTAATPQSGLAGCGLVHTCHCEGDMPLGIRYVNDYDIWNHDNTDVVSFHTAMAIIITDPTTEEGLDFWNELLDLKEEQGEEVMPGLSRGMIPQLVNTGDLILKYKYAVDERRIKHSRQVIDWNGAKGYLVNCEFEDSYSFRDTYKEDDEIKFFVWYNKRRDGRWKYCFRTSPEYQDTFDVAAIAREFGGNGHSGAAGCLVDNEIEFSVIPEN